MILNHPTPFCYNLKNVKAIVLGTDPSNSSENDKRKEVTKAFGIGDSDSRYFDGILSNLKLIGLNLENIYVQNLVQAYLKDDVSKDLTAWKNVVPEWIKILKKELSIFDEKIPVLLTSAYLYHELVHEKIKNMKPIDYYSNPENSPIKPEDNLLVRPLIPFYRHQDYNLRNERWNPYQLRIIEVLNCE